MKTNYSLAMALSLALSVLLIEGCSKNTGTSEAPPPKASAEKTSFNEVTSQLDPGGNLFLYLGTEQWTAGLSSKVSQWRQTFAAMPNLDDADRANVDRTFNVITSLVKDSGLEDISGFGASSIAREPGLYRTKMLLHHYSGKGSGFLWKMFGDQSHDLDGLDLLPANTALAMFSDANLSLIWSVIQQHGEQSGIPQVKDFLAKLPAQFEQSTGMKWNEALDSFGGEYGFLLTLDESAMVAVPTGGQGTLQIPQPGLLLVIKVKNDAIFNRIDSEISKSGQQPISINEPEVKMRTVPVPLPLPIQLRPSIALSGNYLFLASSDSLIREALDVKNGRKPGLKSNDEFKRYAADIPQKGNAFCFMSQRFGQTIMNIQQQALSARAQSSNAQQQWLKSLFRPEKASVGFSVAANTDEGWMTVGNGNQNGGKVMLASAVVAPVGLLSAIAIPNFIKARQTSQKNACINNLRMIESAKQQWALDYGKKTSDVPTWTDLKPYFRGKSVPLHCPEGGTYTIGSVHDQARCSIPEHQVY